MNVFSNEAYISAAGAKNYATEMLRTRVEHMLPPDSPFAGSGNKMIALENKIGFESPIGDGTFRHSLLQALDKVSGAQLHASELSKEAIINPGSVDVHDITIAQEMAAMSFDITRNILNRLVQGWRDLINTR